jgi:hypothetical protein
MGGQDLFDALDVNGAGLLDKNKLKDGLQRGINRAAPDDELNAMLDQMDRSMKAPVAPRTRAVPHRVHHGGSRPSLLEDRWQPAGRVARVPAVYD